MVRRGEDEDEEDEEEEEGEEARKRGDVARPVSACLRLRQGRSGVRGGVDSSSVYLPDGEMPAGGRGRRDRDAGSTRLGPGDGGARDGRPPRLRLPPVHTATDRRDGRATIGAPGASNGAGVLDVAMCVDTCMTEHGRER
ncbi:hypothetical protein CDD83_394 [Cordyceps sp. RAO-2017]|nr:hypothetical protein CDD83_394 [Cordyceps sp. RAO-2017]